MPRPPEFFEAAIDARIDALAEARGLAPELGLFPRGAPIRRVARLRPLLYLGGFHALMQQIAHPMVAQGVFDWSDFALSPTRRMEATSSFLNGLIFGDREHAKHAVKRYAMGHDKVRGVIAAGTCPSRVGEPYDGWDDEARTWVHATIIEAMISAYDLVSMLPHSAGERDAIWQDGRLIADAICLETAAHAPTYAALRAWMDERLDAVTMGELPAAARRPNLHVHRTTRLIAEKLFEKIPDVWGLPDSVAWHTCPPALRTLVPEVERPRRDLEWEAFLLSSRTLMVTGIDALRYTQAFLDYRERVGDVS